MEAGTARHRHRLIKAKDTATSRPRPSSRAVSWADVRKNSGFRRVPPAAAKPSRGRAASTNWMKLLAKMVWLARCHPHRPRRLRRRNKAEMCRRRSNDTLNPFDLCLTLALTFNPLPRGEEITIGRFWVCGRLSGQSRRTHLQAGGGHFSLSSGERAGVRAVIIHTAIAPFAPEPEKTFNLQHSTSKGQGRPPGAFVECWALNVEC